jgi:hypothetical protein
VIGLLREAYYILCFFRLHTFSFFYKIIHCLASVSISLYTWRLVNNQGLSCFICCRSWLDQHRTHLQLITVVSTPVLFWYGNFIAICNRSSTMSSCRASLAYNLGTLLQCLATSLHWAIMLPSRKLQCHGYANATSTHVRLPKIWFGS